MVADAFSAAFAGAMGLLVRFGPPDAGWPGVSVCVALILPLVWVVVMLIARSYEQRFLWVGPEEFRRVLFAAIVLLAIVGTVSWAFKLEVARGFVVLALPLAMALTLLLRYCHRKWLHRQRGKGRFLRTTLLVGHRNSVAALDEQLDREAYHGYRVIGCCLPDHEQSLAADAFNGLPVLGTVDEVADVVKRYELDTVAVLSCPELDGSALSRLGWNLEQTQAELLLAPAITDIAGPRVRIRTVSGRPLMHVERPELRGIRRAMKGVFDRAAAGFGLLVLAPVLVLIALAVKLTSPGPAFFRQERVGRDGQTFTMLKFRSMAVGADQMLDQLAAESDGNGVLFKKKDDPRVTPVGKMLRRYSLDELAQLINVLRGEMSLVGPRPALPAEVEHYDYDMRRRLLVKPGLTGLWQVSGRSNLSWEESVRLDVQYVENSSPAFDLMILWKTVGAVLRGVGAY